eukprot:TRINITY_DN16699_c0_g1_i3.p2 TRINITY_DN16699_c0_g1~~TRINITY_DN16699_c0_g1_i3.p2  ORF type:complete len:172 (-),score=46.35 TRINITY_DN16699_c0_g1_i3:127-642(-)
MKMLAPVLVLAVLCRAWAVDDQVGMSVTLDGAAEQTGTDYQITAMLYNADIVHMAKDSHFNITVTGDRGVASSFLGKIPDQANGMVLRKRFSGPDVGDVQKVRIRSEDSKSVIVFKWIKVKLNDMYWYATMPALVNITTSMPTHLDAAVQRCAATTCEELSEMAEDLVDLD